MDNETDQRPDLDHLNLDTNEMTWAPKLPRDSRGIGGKAVASSNPGHSLANSTPGSNTPSLDTPPRAEKIPKPAEFPLPTPEQRDTLRNQLDNLQDQPNLPPDQSLENLITPNPALETPSKQDTKAVEEALNIPFDRSAFKTTDKLGQTGVEAIDAAVERLNQDGDIANFYDSARQMMEANLDNSYDRKIGEGIK